MLPYYARRVRAAALCCSALWCPGASDAAPLQVPPLQEHRCRWIASDSWQEDVAYTRGNLAVAVRACTLDVAPPEPLFRLDAPFAGCGSARVWEADLQQCARDATRGFDAQQQQGSPRALGVLVAALATPAHTDVDPLTKPSQALVLVEWMFVGALMAFGLLRLALGRD